MHQRETRPACCAATLVNFSLSLLFVVKRLDTILQRHQIRKYPDSPVYTLSDPLRIHFFPLWRADLKVSGFAVKFTGRKPLPGRKGCETSVSVWTGPCKTRTAEVNVSYF